jgi:DNA polymerase-3 subunit alpha
MLLSRLLAGFTRGESDKLRKAMGKKQMDTLQALKGKFMEGGKKNGHNEKILDKIWKDWEAFASYAFNKSHAACYSWVAYQTAYLKAHYPAEFMAANLTINKDDIKEVTKLMDECKAMRISILEPDVNESELNFTVNKKGDIRYGLGGIKGVGEGAVEAIVSEREKNGKYQDLYDFLERVNLQACNRKTVENLAKAGAFDSFEGIYREQILAIGMKGEAVIDTLMRYGNTFQQDKAQQQNSLFGDLGNAFAVDIYKPELPKVPRMSAIEKLNNEKELLGIFLSAHPVDEYEFEVNDLCNITATELTRFDSWRTPEARKAVEAQSENEEEEATEKISPLAWISEHENQPLHFGGIVTSAEEAISQKGNPYGRYVIEDYSGGYKMTLFGKTYAQCAPMLKPNLYVYITGTIQQRGTGRQYFKPKPAEEAEYEFIVQNVELLKDAQQKHIDTLTLHIPLENVNKEFNEELIEILKAHKGDIKLRLQIYDELKQNTINLNANTFPVSIGKEFYHFLKLKEMDGILTHSVS